MAVEDYIFPMQSLTTKAAMGPSANMMGMATSPFAVRGGGGQGANLMGLASLVNQYDAMQGQQQPEQQQANQFASQTPGAPAQPGRVDQTSFQDQQFNPLDLLSQNIARRFGGQ